MWASVEGYHVDLGQARRYGIELQTFADWAREHREDFVLEGVTAGDAPDAA